MLKTFLVEDEVVIREMIKKMIPWEQYGFELAGEASDGEMALPLILKSKPDLLITDIKMPFMGFLMEWLDNNLKSDFGEEMRQASRLFEKHPELHAVLNRSE